MQHSIAANVIRSFTFGMAVVKHLKQVIMLKKSLNIIRASNNIAIIPVKRLQKKWAICTIPSFYYYDQNPSCFALLFKLVPLLIKACWDYQIQN